MRRCTENCAVSGGIGRGRMTMDPKLTLLVMLIAAIVTLSNVNREGVDQLRRSFVGRRWRRILRRT